MSPFWPQGQSIEVRSKVGKPQAWRWEWGDHLVHDISTHWRIHTGWWSGNEVWRDYWEVTTNTGFLCVLYHDLLEGAWYLERIYE